MKFERRHLSAQFPFQKLNFGNGSKKHAKVGNKLLFSSLVLLDFSIFSKTFCPGLQTGSVLPVLILGNLTAIFFKYPNEKIIYNLNSLLKTNTYTIQKHVFVMFYWFLFEIIEIPSTKTVGRVRKIPHFFINRLADCELRTVVLLEPSKLADGHITNSPTVFDGCNLHCR